MMSLTKQREKDAFETLGKSFGYGNRMRSPRITKVIVSTGVGKKRDAKQLALIEDRIARITGQKPSKRGARMSIASFKVREGDTVGLTVTLRGTRMYEFLDKLIHVALPRTRDFHGISPNAIDEMHNITIGVRDHTIFPETVDEDVRDVFGLAITVVTTAKSKEETEAFLRHLGFPLSVDGTAKR